jgi:hypothetical protein
VVPGCHLISKNNEPGGVKQKMLLYPNPASSTLNVFLPAGVELKNKATLQIVNSEGRVMKRFEFACDDGMELTLVCPVGDLASGAYFCVVASADGTVKLSGKFIK